MNFSHDMEVLPQHTVDAICTAPRAKFNDGFQWLQERTMSIEKARAAAKKDKGEGKSASTQAGEYVREVIEDIRKGKHGARSTKQAIAIGLSEARRDGIKAPVSKTASKTVKKKATQDAKAAAHPHKPLAARSKATTNALKREGHSAASTKSLSAQTKKASAQRAAASRSAAAKKAVKTKGAAGLSAAAKKAALTRKKSG
jgi:membrane protein involved in colicin uptake